MPKRVLIGSLLAALDVAGSDASAGEFVAIDSGTKAEPVRLIGYLALPQGAGPFSAVVLLHGCGGFFFHEQAADGYAALGYLAAKPFGRTSHVALMGLSMGGGSVLAALERASSGNRRKGFVPA